MAAGWRYQCPGNVTLATVQDRPAWAAPQGGRVVTDVAMLDLWQAAHDHTLDEVIERSNVAPDVVRAALGCLAEAGVLERHGLAALPVPRPHLTPSACRVSIVLVTYQSQDWIAECLASVQGQTHEALELIVVDNGSPDDPRALVEKACPEARYVRLSPGGSFAAALNAGAAISTGAYLFFLNPDVALEADAVAQLVATADAQPLCGAIAAKLKFYWAPAFLNGLGNRVEAASWGSDNAIGHLDLNQFDGLSQVPSACFAATLIRRSAWDQVGPADEGFPMYYEDVEWCYRARRLGWGIGLAPAAVVYHAFGSRLATGDEPGLSPRKLSHIVYGRLRFVMRVFDGADRWRFLRGYLREDLGNYRALSNAGDLASSAAYRRAWWRAVRDVLGMYAAGLRISRRATTPIASMLAADARWPSGLTWAGVPELTLAGVTDVYLPLIRAGRTRPLPEWPHAGEAA